MQVAISAAGPTLDSPVDGRFGRCKCFVVVNTETLEFEVLDNTAAARGSGAGIAAAQIVAGSAAEAVAAANIGPSAFQALSVGGLELYQCGSGTVRQAVEALRRGELPRLASASVAAHSGTAPK